MYEQYTDKQIVEMLVPKLKKAVPEVSWDAIKANPDFHRVTNKMVATIYRSGYIRGQKGRSFLIGEKKSEVKGKKGDKVCWFSDDRDIYFPNKKGTIGTVDSVDGYDSLWVYWPVGSCEVHKHGKECAETTWCCIKKQCLLIDTNVKGNIKKGDRIVYLGRKNGFLCNDVCPNQVATGVVDCANNEGCLVFWDSPDVVTNRFNGHTHVWYEDIAKVIPWD